MQMIADGKIKEGTKVKVIYGVENPIYCFRNNCFYKENIEMGVSVLLSSRVFEILEDTTEEIEECVIRHYNTPVEKEKYIEEKMNEIIKAVNIIKKTFTVDTSKETNCMSE